MLSVSFVFFFNVSFPGPCFPQWQNRCHSNFTCSDVSLAQLNSYSPFWQKHEQIMYIISKVSIQLLTRVIHSRVICVETCERNTSIWLEYHEQMVWWRVHSSPRGWVTSVKNCYASGCFVHSTVYINSISVSTGLQIEACKRQVHAIFGANCDPPGTILSIRVFLWVVGWLKCATGFAERDVTSCEAEQIAAWV